MKLGFEANSITLLLCLTLVFLFNWRQLQARKFRAAHGMKAMVLSPAVREEVD